MKNTVAGQMSLELIRQEKEEYYQQVDVTVLDGFWKINQNFLVYFCLT